MRRIAFAVLVVVGCVNCGCESAVRTGLDVVADHRELFEGKRVGIVTNHTARDSRGRHIVDVFMAMEGVKVTALFGPEHGIYGLAEAGEKVGGGVDEVYGLAVHSLYGSTNKPTAEMLEDVDVLVFDIQDVGARFYTYVYTMALAMEAAAENGKAFVVLDRPNPINGAAVEGPILQRQYASFVGKYPIAVRHGMTVGELAKMFDGQGWLAGGVRAEPAVVPMKGWRREMWYDQTGLKFIKPSPNMPDLETATVYPGLCLLEGTNVSEGRGTDMPFLQFGAPWIDPAVLVERLNGLRTAGVRFAPTEFEPSSSKWAGEKCFGARIEVLDRDALESFWCGVRIVEVLRELGGERFEWRSSHFDRLCGTSAVRKAIINGDSLEQLREGWEDERQAFAEIRRRYLLYGR